MFIEVKENVWFDNESIKIFKGKEEERKEFLPIPSKKHVPSVHDEGWKPSIIYIAAAACNLKCKYCYADKGTYGIHSAKRQFTFEDYVATYSKMWDLHQGVKAVSFFGGEPLLNFKEIKKFVEYLYATYEKEQLPTLAVNTNGTILNEEILEFLSKYHFIIGTSIDGTKEIHDENRIGDCISSTYEVVTGNLDAFHKKGMKVFVQYTFTKQHLDRYSRGMAVKWCREMEQLPINTYEMIPVSTNNPEYKLDMENKDTLEAYTTFCGELADYYLYKLGNEEIDKVPRMFIGLVIRLLMQMEQNECSAGYSVSITPGGEVYPCHTFTEHSEYGMHISDINSKADLLGNEHFTQIKQANRERSELCQNCISKKICGIWCKGLQNDLKGDAKIPLDERCILMNIYTKKIIRFLAEEYPESKAKINRKLIDYNNLHK